MRFLIHSLLLLILIPAARSNPDMPLPDKIEFNRDVRPILSDKCFHCHGTDAKTRKAKLRLDHRDDALKDNEGTRAIVPGDLKASELVLRIHADDPEERMPPEDSHKTLDKKEIGILEKWILQGAEYQQHWAYAKPQKPAVESGKNAIDALVQKRLAAIDLTPSKEADRPTLVRRLYLDVIGLPPTSEEVARFVQDTAPNAYEKVVDHVMASPHYGERLALPWLDVVRYADTIGYHSDNPRNVWPYRDYVIRSFNNNKRFDEFTREQIAGDLLPNGTREQKVASAFNRLLLTTEEGGAQAKDYEARMLGDRVRAVGSAWLGATIGCAQCHDHKFDPLTSRDFYALGAFFADIKEDSIGPREPGMLLPTPEQETKQNKIKSELDPLEKKFDAPMPDIDAEQRAWENEVAAIKVAETNWQITVPQEPFASENGTEVVRQDDYVHATKSDKIESDIYKLTIKTGAEQITGFRLLVVNDDKNPHNGLGHSGEGTFILSEVSVDQKKPDGSVKRVPISHATATFERSGFAAAEAIDGIIDDDKNGWSVANKPQTSQAIYFEFKKPITGAGEKTLKLKLHQTAGENQKLGKFQIALTSIDGPVRSPRYTLPSQSNLDWIAVEPKDRNDEQKKKLKEHFRNAHQRLTPLRLALQAKREELHGHENTMARCLVSESTKPRTVRIFPRGNWMDESGPEVTAALPAFLAADLPPRNEPPTRKDLAEWLVSKENPLTARVFVNRLWKQFFGMGLSKVLDDFGAQGEPPVNPELLDWLACEFMDSGWDIKHLVKNILMSATYRQDSTASKELQTRDPYNRELARQSRWRLEAELVRDNALAISGLLKLKIGGPSVKPYQPENYWENLNFPTRTYTADQGDNQYRRGLYTWWQRSFLHPSMVAFDAPTREECTAERNRSNIPQQALALLNDPTYVEASRVFAARILKEAPVDLPGRIVWAFQQATARQPTADELEVVRSVYEKHLASFKQNEASAKALLGVGLAPVPAEADKAELSAWTSVARIILNLHETITRS